MIVPLRRRFSLIAILGVAAFVAGTTQALPADAVFPSPLPQVTLCLSSVGAPGTPCRANPGQWIAIGLDRRWGAGDKIVGFNGTTSSGRNMGWNYDAKQRVGDRQADIVEIVMVPGTICSLGLGVYTITITDRRTGSSANLLEKFQPICPTMSGSNGALPQAPICLNSAGPVNVPCRVAPGATIAIALDTSWGNGDHGIDIGAYQVPGPQRVGDGRAPIVLIVMVPQDICKVYKGQPMIVTVLPTSTALGRPRQLFQRFQPIC
jgi:hypothetical protein